MKTLTLLLVAALAIVAQPAPSHAETAEVSMELRKQISAGWTFYETGNHRQAVEALEAAIASPEGARNAEIHYLLGAVWWDRRNAAAAVRLWSEAERKAKEQHDWDTSEEYNARIDQRLIFVRKNFGVVKLRTAGRRSLPPQADPVPKDPVLAGFVDAVQALVEEAGRDRVDVIWVALPKGSYWVGEQRLALDAGGLDLARAPQWTLVANIGSAKRSFELRAGVLAAGGTVEATSVTPAKDVDAGRYEQRFGHLAFGGGGVSVPAQSGSGAISHTLHVEAGVDIPLGVPGVALSVAFSYADLPVSMCSALQTRAGALAGHVAPRLSRHLRDRLWLSGEIGFHVGGGFAQPGSQDRRRCAAARLDAPAGDIRYGAAVGEDGEAVAFAQLGWDGPSMLLGPHGEIGILGSPGQGDFYVGVAFFLRYDQVFAVTDGGTVRYKNDAGVQSTEVGSISGLASMSRLQFGLRGRLKF